MIMSKVPGKLDIARCEADESAPTVVSPLVGADFMLSILQCHKSEISTVQYSVCLFYGSSRSYFDDE